MIIVDTNILIYHWTANPRSLETNALLRLDPEWAAPLLWRSEMRNVLALGIRRRELTVVDAETLMRHAAASLLAGEHAVADDQVFALVAASKCTAYDCEFVALAKALGTLLITEDKVLLNSFPTLCRSLTDAVRRGLRS